MPLELLEEAYGEIQGWRYKAYHSIKGRTGKYPAQPFGPSG